MVQGCLSGLLRSLTLVIRSFNQTTSPGTQQGRPARGVLTKTLTQGRCTRDRALCEAGGFS